MEKKYVVVRMAVNIMKIYGLDDTVEQAEVRAKNLAAHDQHGTDEFHIMKYDGYNSWDNVGIIVR